MNNNERGENMPNIKSQIKTVGTNAKARGRNAHFKTRVRSQIKKVRVALEAKDVELAEKEYREAISLLDKAVTKGVFHANKVAHHKSELTLKINELKK